MEECLERDGIRKVGRGDGEHQQGKCRIQEKCLRHVAGNAGEELSQDEKVVEADDDAEKEKCGAPSRQAADDRQVGSKPVGAAGKDQRVDGNDAVGDKR